MTRIVSLIPSATEIICALGFAAELVGRSHECDYPPAVRALPALTQPKFDVLQNMPSVYKLDEAKLNELAPDVIVTQAQASPCAVSLSEVERVARASLTTPARIVSLEPMQVADVLADILRLAEALGAPERGAELTLKLQLRLDDIAKRAGELTVRPTVACVEWIDPLMVGGRWMPELVTMAGGAALFAKAGKQSPWVHWDDLWAADPDVIAVMPCGFAIERSRAEMAALTNQPGWKSLRAIREGRVYLTDGSQYFSRPGPRLVESLEILAEIVHPEAFHFGHEGTGWVSYES